ncbi:hypothetical protein E2C01_039148 [Portunus trituberculatus]|uniref:Uncharacterized protein n=1 Tax=Portunus trituberculatus TaxID=210409 RepID=A0A5B7FJV8_PORTR|nr:hypothetical protein [Portunus trituberculatus]
MRLSIEGAKSVIRLSCVGVARLAVVSVRTSHCYKSILNEGDVCKCASQGSVTNQETGKRERCLKVYRSKKCTKSRDRSKWEMFGSVPLKEVYQIKGQEQVGDIWKCTDQGNVPGLQAHGFESCPRSECRLGFFTRGNGFLAGGL